MSRIFAFLRRNWSVLLGALGMIPILFFLLLIVTVLFAPPGWNEMSVPASALLL